MQNYKTKSISSFLSVKAQRSSPNLHELKYTLTTGCFSYFYDAFRPLKRFCFYFNKQFNSIVVELVSFKVLPLLQVLLVWILCKLARLDNNKRMFTLGQRCPCHNGVQLLDTCFDNVAKPGGIIQCILPPCYKTKTSRMAW